MPQKNFEGFANYGNGFTNQVTRNITSSELLNLKARPFLLIAGVQGAIIIPVFLFASCGAGVQYAGVDNGPSVCTLYSDGTAGFWDYSYLKFLVSSGFLATPLCTNGGGLVSTVDKSKIVGQPLILLNQSGAEYTTGTFAMEISVMYALFYP